MLNTAAHDLARLQELPALLNALPAFAEALGFHFYSFSYNSPTHEVYASNLLSGGRWLVQAALEAKPHHDHQYPCPPVLWTALSGRPHWWDVAQVQRVRREPGVLEQGSAGHQQGLIDNHTRYPLILHGPIEIRACLHNQ